MSAQVDLSASSRRAKDEQMKLLEEIQTKQLMQKVVVPTDDKRVRQMLRQIREPITLFGEREMERRDRLRQLMASMTEDQRRKLLAGINFSASDDHSLVLKEKFYTEGSDQLIQARYEILMFSLEKAQNRLILEREKVNNWDNELDLHINTITKIQSLNQEVVQQADSRPLQGCSFSSDAAFLATSGWGGQLRLWETPALEKFTQFSAHEERCVDVQWNPQFSKQNLNVNVGVATACADGIVSLWRTKLSQSQDQLFEIEKNHQLTGHTDRLARIKFHPMGKFLATASYDQTWRLWDIEVGETILEQEGHSREVYCLGFHPDGSLMSSSGFDSHAWIWDCRTGRQVMVLQGHVRPILSLDFSPNGYGLITGSMDNQCKVWDLRKKECVYTLPAHSKLVSVVKFDPLDGRFVLSGSYDRCFKIWCAKSFRLLRSVATSERVMGADIAADGSLNIATVHYNREVSLWAPLMDIPLDQDADGDVVMN